MGGGGDSHMTGVQMLVLSQTEGCKLRILVSVMVFRIDTNIFSCQGLV